MTEIQITHKDRAWRAVVPERERAYLMVRLEDGRAPVLFNSPLFLSAPPLIEDTLVLDGSRYRVLAVQYLSLPSPVSPVDGVILMKMR